MRSKRSLLVEGLEGRLVMSHFIAQPHHALAVRHAPHMVTSFGAHHGIVVHHSNLKAAAAKAATPAQTTGFGGGAIDLTIPFITGTPQFPLNFTSNTFQNVLFGTGGWDGIQQIAIRFGATNDVNQLTSDITALAVRMPFGKQELLPTWMTDLESLQSGALTPTPSGITWDHVNASGQAVGDVLFADLTAYLADGLGTSFNILKSAVNWNNSDNLLTYNGTVGSNSLT
jgi:hypothetical protein